MTKKDLKEYIKEIILQEVSKEDVEELNKELEKTKELSDELGLTKENLNTFQNYSNNELAAYTRELSKQRADAASKGQTDLIASLNKDIEAATRELKKRSQNLKALSRTDESSKSDSIPGANYLTPSKEELDSWNKDKVFKFLEKLSDQQYKAQINNQELKLDSLVQAEKAIKNYFNINEATKVNEAATDRFLQSAGRNLARQMKGKSASRTTLKNQLYSMPLANRLKPDELEKIIDYTMEEMGLNEAKKKTLKKN